jgi:hypothetical protein
MSASPQPTLPASRGEPATVARRISRSQLRAPAAEGGLLQIPPLAGLPVVAQANARGFQMLRCGGDWLEDFRPCADERHSVRTEVWQAAEGWTKRLLTAAGHSDGSRTFGAERGWQFSPPLSVSKLWLVTGHQPALFHPGVWIKNFAVTALARRLGDAVGLNLIVDNDVAPTPSLLVPSGSLSAPRWESLAYDTSPGAAPWEEIRVTDRNLFESFGGRVGQVLAPWGIAPLAVEFWPRVLQAEQALNNPGWAFSAARAATEWSWGAGNLELPLSGLCQLPCFHRFVVRLLNQLPRFHAVYNRALADYRQVYRIRSRTHPVPDLRSDQDWLEAPFWVWCQGERQRRRLMVRRVADRLELSDGRATLDALPSGVAGLPTAMAVLQRLATRGIRLRTRALTTTLFSRLYLSDLFVHGIGGAKYDEMTDQIIRDFCQMDPPPFATLSATLRLPLPSLPVNSQTVRQLKHTLRSAEQHPGSSLDHPDSPRTNALLSELSGLIAEQQAVRRGEQTAGHLAGAGPLRYRRFHEIRQELRAATAETRERLVGQLVEAERQLAANRILRSREYAFCLFPPHQLRSFVEDACDTIE